MLDRDIAKLRQIRILGERRHLRQLPAPRGVTDLPLRGRLDHVLGLQPSRRGPVAQGIEQQPSKLKVAGSNPAGVANNIKDLWQMAGGTQTNGLTTG